MEDELVAQCLAAWNQEGSGSREGIGGLGQFTLRMLRRVMGAAAGECAFLPTGSLQLFETLHAVRPRHRLVASDFDALPETSVDGWNAPLVATTVCLKHLNVFLPFC